MCPSPSCKVPIYSDILLVNKFATNTYYVFVTTIDILIKYKHKRSKTKLWIIHRRCLTVNVPMRAFYARVTNGIRSTSS